jgi:hypothetical protein
MTRTRLGLLGLCAVVFGLMAFSATAAQAEVGAKWLFAEKGAGTKLVPFLEATVGLEAETVGVLHTKIAGVEVLFECKKLATVSATLQANGSVGGGAKIKFSECETFLNKKLSIPCEPFVGAEKGVITTQAGHALIELHKLASGVLDDIVRILPDDVGGKPSEIFAIIRMGPECAIGEEVPVLGKATLKDCVSNEQFLTHLVKHLVEIGPLTELWTISKTAEHVAEILGSSWAFLNGAAHVGLKFSGDPA